MDEFEQFLSKQPLRPVPPEWRRELLVAGAVLTRQPWWREWLWPSPAAWATLGCAWLVIIALNLAARPSAQETAKRTPATSSDIAVAFAEQRRLLAELTGLESVRRRAQPVEPGPHSELSVNTQET
jgi:hypothetical protein